MCQTPGDTIEQRVEIFNNTMIDIVDLLHELRIDTPARIWTDEEESFAYTEQRTIVFFRQRRRQINSCHYLLRRE